MRFHPLHGKNITLDEDRLVATRTNSFTHGMLFSERPLDPGELFVVEIEETSPNWFGNIIIGLTPIPPQEILERCVDNVVYDDIYHIMIPNRPVTGCPCTCGHYRPLFNIGRSNDDYIHTPFASITRQSIESVRKDDKYPTNVGGRVGVVYAIKQNAIHAHRILNGIDCGPFAKFKIESSSSMDDGPARKRQRTEGMAVKQISEETKFWAFVDIYGATKRVRVLQLYGPNTLKSLCRSTILSNLKFRPQISNLPLGPRLQLFLKFCGT